MSSRAAAGRGVLARFFFARPASKLGFRDLEPPAVSTSASDWYGARLHLLLDRRVPDEPALLHLSSEASQLLLEFRKRVETELRPDGKFSDHAAWGGKLAGAVVRIAGVLHGIGHPNTVDAGIDAETMQAALAWAPYLESHERHVAWLAGDNGATTVAERILGWVERHHLTEFTHNQAYNAVRGSRVQKSKDLDAPLALLEELGCIRAKTTTTQPRGPGRPSSRLYEVNPWLHDPDHETAPQYTQNTQYSGPDGDVAGPSAVDTGSPPQSRGPSGGDRGHSHDGDEWSTPPEVIESARQVLGTIDLDPATNPTAQGWIRATRIFTKTENGLLHPWRGRVWLNPPYSYPLVEQFSRKLIARVPGAAMSRTPSCWSTAAPAPHGSTRSPKPRRRCACARAASGFSTRRDGTADARGTARSSSTSVPTPSGSHQCSGATASCP